MQTKWIVRAPDGDKSFETSQEAADFMKANLRNSGSFGIIPPDDATNSDWKAFKGFEIRADFGKKDQG